MKFVGLSGIGWLLDFSIYVTLGLLYGNLVLNNMISSWVGVTFVFLIATRKIFKNRGIIPLGCKYLIYLLYQGLLIFIISKFLNYINSFIVGKLNLDIITRSAPIISKILVTPVTMILNFLVMKNVIEKI